MSPLFKVLAWYASVLFIALSSVSRARPLDSSSTTELIYDYIVVGSGAGGGPLACRLAMAGYKTLLIEAGNDQAGNINISVPGYQSVVSNDKKLRWDFFVNHYQDQARAQLDPKYSWETAPYEYHVGPDPPEGAKPLGVLYPRAGTLGGCVTHNALVLITPFASDWDNIAQLTGDSSWAATNMDQYLDKVYEWLPVETTNPQLLLLDSKLTQHVAGGAAAVGVGPPDPINAAVELASILQDPNSRVNPARDSTRGYFYIPLITKGGVRTAVRDFIDATVQAGHPLTIRQNCHVTKINFENNGTTIVATGVTFLDGDHLYSASPLSGGKGTPGSATATKEVIISGGTFNTPQLLKLSGIGPAAELNSFDIPIVSDLAGVGQNMMDRYEISVNVQHPTDFNILKGCTFDGKAHDLCLAQWENNPDVLAEKGVYAGNGLAAATIERSNYASNTNNDLAIFSAPIDFRGYFPGWSDAATGEHDWFSYYNLKAGTRNRAGTVALRSTNPLDTPIIDFNYFDTGTTAGGVDDLDLLALVQAVNHSRQALNDYYKYDILGGDKFVEIEPGPNVTSTEGIGNYIKQRTWGHHACCSAAIGADDNSRAVLDSKFRVRGVQNLRVVDASVFPSIPGFFIQAPIFMISEKAADVIINGC